MVEELKSTTRNWTGTKNSTPLVLFVYISIILSASMFIAFTNITLKNNSGGSTSNPDPPQEPNPDPDPSSFGWIAGIVTEILPSHTRIKGANVNADEHFATTDAKGYYKIEVPAPGTYSLIASAENYYTQTVTDIFIDTPQSTVAVNFYLTLVPLEPEPVEEKHDVAVSNVLSSTSAYQGEVVTVQVYLVNPGDYEETFDLEVMCDRSSIGTRSVFLASHDSKTEVFSWNTTDVSLLIHTINAAAILARDEVLINNFASASIVIKPCVGWIEGYVYGNETSLPISGATVSATMYTTTTDPFGYYTLEVPSPSIQHITVTADKHYNKSKPDIFVDNLATVKINFTLVHIAKPPMIHDVAVTSLSAPSEVCVGSITKISVGVENLGNYEETFAVKVVYGPNIISTETLALHSKESTALSFTWNTSNIAPDEYSVTAEALLETDEDPTNDQTAIKISVNLEQPEKTFTWIGTHVNLTLAEWAHNISFHNVVVRYDSDQEDSMNNLAQYGIKFWRWVPYYRFENATTENALINILQDEILASPSKRIYIDDVDAIFMLYKASVLSSFLSAVEKVQHNNIILCFYMSNQTAYQGLYEFLDQYDWSKFHVDIYSPPYVEFSALIPLVNARTLGTYLWLWPYSGIGNTWKNVSLNDIICRYSDAISNIVQRFDVWMGYEPETYEVGMEAASLYKYPHWWTKITNYNRNFLEGNPIPRDKGVILWFDDGLLNTYEVARKILRYYGYTGVMSTITGMVSDYESERCIWDDGQWRDKPIMILQELSTMQNEGWEIVSHSQSHPYLSSLQEYYARWEIEGSKEWISDNLGPMKNPCFVYPYGEVYWAPIVDEHYAYQRLGANGQEAKMIWHPNLTPTHIPVVDANLSKEIIDYWLNETNQRGGVAIFVLHGIYENPEPGSLENSLDTLEYLLKEIKEMEMPVLTLTQALELFQIKPQDGLSIGAQVAAGCRIEGMNVCMVVESMWHIFGTWSSITQILSTALIISANYYLRFRARIKKVACTIEMWSLTIHSWLVR